MPLKKLRKQNHKRLNSLFGIFAFVFLGFLHNSYAYDPNEYESQNNDVPKQIENVGISEKLGTDLNKLNIDVIDETGAKKSLTSFFGKQRPVILSLVYYSCPSMCNLHLNGVLDGLKQLSLVAGKDYDLLAVSFDPKEDADLAAAKKYTYQEKYNFPDNGSGIHFLTASESAVKTLADAIGFKYKWDNKAKEWAHASAAVLVTPNGVVSRYLHGVYFEPKTFRLSLVEAGQGKVGDIIDSVVLYCFIYDGSRYGLYWFNLMRAGAALICLIMGMWLFLFWRKSRRQIA